MDNSEISENHLKAIVGWLQVVGVVGFRRVPIYRQRNRGAKGKRGKVALEAGSCTPEVLIWDESLYRNLGDRSSVLGCWKIRV